MFQNDFRLREPRLCDKLPDKPTRQLSCKSHNVRKFNPLQEPPTPEMMPGPSHYKDTFNHQKTKPPRWTVADGTNVSVSNTYTGPGNIPVRSRYTLLARVAFDQNSYIQENNAKRNDSERDWIGNSGSKLRKLAKEKKTVDYMNDFEVPDELGTKSRATIDLTDEFDEPNESTVTPAWCLEQTPQTVSDEQRQSIIKAFTLPVTGHDVNKETTTSTVITDAVGVNDLSHENMWSPADYPSLTNLEQQAPMEFHVANTQSEVIEIPHVATNCENVGSTSAYTVQNVQKNVVTTDIMRVQNTRRVFNETNNTSNTSSSSSTSDRVHTGSDGHECTLPCDVSRNSNHTAKRDRSQTTTGKVRKTRKARLPRNETYKRLVVILTKLEYTRLWIQRVVFIDGRINVKNVPLGNGARYNTRADRSKPLVSDAENQDECLRCYNIRKKSHSRNNYYSRLEPFARMNSVFIYRAARQPADTNAKTNTASDSSSWLEDGDRVVIEDTMSNCDNNPIVPTYNLSGDSQHRRRINEFIYRPCQPEDNDVRKNVLIGPTCSSTIHGPVSVQRHLTESEKEILDKPGEIYKSPKFWANYFMKYNSGTMENNVTLDVQTLEKAAETGVASDKSSWILGKQRVKFIGKSPSVEEAVEDNSMDSSTNVRNKDTRKTVPVRTDVCKLINLLPYTSGKAPENDRNSVALLPQPNADPYTEVVTHARDAEHLDKSDRMVTEANVSNCDDNPTAPAYNLSGKEHDILISEENICVEDKNAISAGNLLECENQTILSENKPGQLDGEIPVLENYGMVREHENVVSGDNVVDYESKHIIPKCNTFVYNETDGNAIDCVDNDNMSQTSDDEMDDIVELQLIGLSEDESESESVVFDEDVDIACDDGIG